MSDKEKMTPEQFMELAKNRNLYRVLKPLTGELSYAEIGDTFYSDTLYKRGYNMIDLMADGTIERIGEPYDFQLQLVGKNIHSVYVKCGVCGAWGINEPLNTECGNCGYSKCTTYYDAETINNLLNPVTPPITYEK